MEHISRRVKALSVSQTLAMAQKSRELKEQGIDVISLSLGEPDFNTPDDIKEAAKKAIDDNYSFYPPVPGYGDLREAIARKFKEENGLDYTPDQIVVSAGGKHTLINILISVVDPGEEVILLAPYWVSYLDQIIFAEGKPVIIQTTIEDDFKVTPSQLEAAITPRTRVLIFNSPSNPTGMVYTKAEMAALVTVLERYPEILIISDEIYEHITFSGPHISLASFPSITHRVATVNGVSKGYAMTGWRIGYMGAPLWLAKACNKLQGQFTSGVCSIAQRAALAAVTSRSDSKEKMREAFVRRRDLICRLLEEIPGLKVRVPQGAFYVMPDISNFIGRSYNGKVMTNADDLTFFLLEEGRVAMVSGSAFGADNCIRISYATSDDRITEAVRRIREALAKLN